MAGNLSWHIPSIKSAKKRVRNQCRLFGTKFRSEAAANMKPIHIVHFCLAAGGKWSGGMVLIFESAPASKRGALAIWSPGGTAFGFVLSRLSFLVAQWLSPDDFQSRVWRMPFRCSAIHVALGLWMRRSLDEAPTSPVSGQPVSTAVCPSRKSLAVVRFRF